MGVVIAFANQKGGVGKTTSAVNIAAALGIRGKKTLLIDADPQGNASSGVGINKKSIRLTTYEILIGKCSCADAVITTKFTNLSVIPSNINLAAAEFEIINLDDREARLKKPLDLIKDDYDYVIIDCPPSIGILTINALTACNGVVIPMQCEYYSLEGLSQLMISLRQVKKLYNPTLEITGILITMYNGRLNLSVQVLDELKKFYADKLFSIFIQRNVKLSEAPSFGMPIMYYDKTAKGNSYMEIADELLERTGM
ncbi:MAG: AAA family ATPase [Oscillospiraceae bacterium]|nr:AAA family ATPase [Oscillospiraceae bacterium]